MQPAMRTEAHIKTGNLIAGVPKPSGRKARQNGARGQGEQQKLGRQFA